VSSRSSLLNPYEGAPGSQNGYDNSGQRTSNPQWDLDPNNVGRTLDLMAFLANTLNGTIDVLELMNEPAAFLGNNYPQVLRGYYQNSYNAIRNAVGNGTQVMIDDGFLGVNVMVFLYVTISLP
jgi:glucan 1,3-beta-glucosidase